MFCRGLVPRVGRKQRRDGNTEPDEVAAGVAHEDPRGRPVYWVGPVGPEQDSGPGTDFHAVRSGYVSITPLDVDLTRYDAIDGIASWLAE